MYRETQGRTSYGGRTLTILAASTLEVGKTFHAKRTPSVFSLCSINPTRKIIYTC